VLLTVIVKRLVSLICRVKPLKISSGNYVMPPLKPPRIYWDSDVFLSYFSKQYPDRHANIQAVLDEVESSKDSLKIVTSVLAKAEVAYIAEEKTTPADYPNISPFAV